MIPYLSDDIYSRIIDLAEEGDNPLAVDNPLGNVDRMCSAVNEALDGMDDDTAQRVASSLRNKAPMRDGRTTNLDRITAEMLTYHSVDPLMVAWISRVCNGVNIHDEDDDDMGEFVEIDGFFSPEDGETCTTVVTVDHGVQWRASGEMIIQVMAESLVPACPGRRLREIISHPVFNRHDMRVVDAQTRADAIGVVLSTDHEPQMLDVDALLAMRP